MRVVKLRIDGQEFFLPGDADVAALQKQIVAAVVGVAAFVVFRPIGYGEVAVLVTSRVRIHFEVEEHLGEEVDGWSDNRAAVDVEDVFPTF